MYLIFSPILKITLSLSALLGAIVIYFIWSFVRQQRRVMKWQQERISAEIETLENERKRIAEDLHDELGPMLSAIKLQINHLEPTDEFDQTILDKSSGQIDFIIERFRDISYNLLPNTLVRKGLKYAIEEYIYKMQRASNLAITFSGVNTIPLPQESEINLYRIVQEIVHNAVKHSRASVLKISLQFNKKNELVLTTEDNGVGFVNTKESEKNNGLGLLNLSSRVDVLNGTIECISTPGLGTKYFIKIPLQK
jgi:signal transduction histidine kinase